MKYLLIAILTIMTVAIETKTGSAQNDEEKKYTREQVEKLIQQAEARLKETEHSGAAELARPELEQIKDSIENSKNYLGKDEQEKAYYQIQIGLTLFEKINAIIELNVSRKLYKQKEQQWGK